MENEEKSRSESRALLRGWDEWEFVSVASTSRLTLCFDLCKLQSPSEESLRAPLIGIVNHGRSTDLPPRVPCPPRTVGMSRVSFGEGWCIPVQEAGKQSPWTPTISGIEDILPEVLNHSGPSGDTMFRPLTCSEMCIGRMRLILFDSWGVGLGFTSVMLLEMKHQKYP